MSQLNNGTSLPTQPAASEGGMPGDGDPANPTYDDNFVRVSRDQLRDYNGDYHAALNHAKTYRELGDYASLAQEFKQNGWGPDDIRAFANQYAEQINGQTGGSLPQQTQGLSPAQLQTMLDENNRQVQDMMRNALTQHSTEAQQAADRQRAIENGQRAMHTACDSWVTARGMKLTRDGQDGKQIPDPFAESMYLRYKDHLLETLQKGLPEGVTREQAEMLMASPTPEAVEAANQAMAWVSDLKYEHAAAVAGEQETTPPASLGSGPGGKQQPGDWESMSEQQRVEAATAGVDLSGL